ncbi:SDR family oxidoreductase [Streptomyces sp. So13.3]|uniref:SDR family oxidoreductase n=1 Tax=Streptomyces TaxID=1883 RepID=UPI001105F73E|nr:MULTISPECIES: SDR family oxidoreductase [Streptomyces]MCZ4099721.1 SDR family oxidoreductase [Streptomyces sp. H39-C1]QNA70971.1 SDR family oxidoreductase [Streptomyces sp. So13.3]
MGRRWLVTGCSSGLGHALATAAARAGDELAVTARKTADLEELAATWPGRITPIPLELRDAASCEEAVRIAVDRLGGIDILVNNAGVGLFGAVEEVSDAELRDQLETLLVGPWRLTRLVLPLMRTQGHGHILNVSSVVGRIAFPGLAAYVAGKHALEGMSQALTIEAAPHNIRVTVLEPGMFATRYGTSMTEAGHRVPAYDGTNREMLEGSRGLADHPETGRPEDFAARVLDIVAAAAPTPLRIPVGDDAYGYLDQAEQEAREEFAAARILARGPLPA